MTTPVIIRLSLIVVATTGLFVYRHYNNKKPSTLTNSSKAPVVTPDFYSINDGNQDKIVFAPDYNKEWFDGLDKKYSWNNFGAYDNRFWEYMYNIFDTLPALAKGKTASDRDFFNKLTRGQKIFYSVLVFNGDTDNGGVYQFFFNRPEFCFAVLETFKELELDTLSKDYENCLNEFIGSSDSYSKRKTIFNDSNNSWEKRFKSFSDGYGDLKSGKKIEEYYYKDEFKKQLYKTVVDYVDNNLNQFVKK
jgi:hypothetical protein